MGGADQKLKGQNVDSPDFVQSFKNLRKKGNYSKFLYYRIATTSTTLPVPLQFPHHHHKKNLCLAPWHTPVECLTNQINSAPNVDRHSWHIRLHGVHNISDCTLFTAQSTVQNTHLTLNTSHRALNMLTANC